MNAGSPRGAISMPVVLGLIIAGATLFSGVFFYLFHQLNLKVEKVIRDQFNQQQLVLARKIAEGVENHLDFLESSLLTMSRVGATLAEEPGSPGFHRYLTTRLEDLFPLGALDLAWYGPDGLLKLTWRGQPAEGQVILKPGTLEWARQPTSRGRLFLERTRPGPYPLSGSPGHVPGRPALLSGAISWCPGSGGRPLLHLRPGYQRGALRGHRLSLDHQSGRHLFGPL